MTANKNNAVFEEIISYTPPQLYQGKEWYIGFMAYDPAMRMMRRKKIKLNHIEKIGERRKYAGELIKRLTQQLERGWNPWIFVEDGKAYKTFNDACAHYEEYVTKLFKDDFFREDTYIGYMSYLKNLRGYNNDSKCPIYYIYQFTKLYIIEFLEEIYIGRENCAQTRDNYLAWLRIFSTFLIQSGYLSSKPTDGINSLGRRARQKKRTVFEASDLLKFGTHCEKKNKYFLLASYVLYYCFIRPKEMSKIQLSHISLVNQTIFIPSENSKNKKDGMVTLPQKVIMLMLDLNIFNNPSSYYLFSDGFMPGKERRSEKRFRDYFLAIRKELKLPESYKFYSLKDTGITDLLRQIDTLSVRDQARHSTILMTDTYTPHDIQVANKLIEKYSGDF